MPSCAICKKPVISCIVLCDNCSNELLHNKSSVVEEYIPSVTRVGFVNPETGCDDETEFDTRNPAEIIELFMRFCQENRFGCPSINYVCYIQNIERECQSA